MYRSVIDSSAELSDYKNGLNGLMFVSQKDELKLRLFRGESKIEPEKSLIFLLTSRLEEGQIGEAGSLPV